MDGNNKLVKLCYASSYWTIQQTEAYPVMIVLSHGCGTLGNEVPKVARELDLLFRIFSCLYLKPDLCRTDPSLCSLDSALQAVFSDLFPTCAEPSLPGPRSSQHHSNKRCSATLHCGWVWSNLHVASTARLDWRQSLRLHPTIRRSDLPQRRGLEEYENEPFFNK